ncbi:hypothetical protein HU200_015851 [Digitaria exilis]|uniref:Shugoshin C-terminal domain-containing protein n=1 Tax=Digitaria exilis TaxID=1010633 RepID=A0A835KIV9_9POAL|nr:hypothetical protein HU200_015851 [Digitaria exilis]
MADRSSGLLRGRGASPRRLRTSLTLGSPTLPDPSALPTSSRKTIDHSRVEIHNLRLTVQILRQQNQQFAQTNSQMNTEISTCKDRIKALQHELSCKVAVLKVKDSEVELKNKTANQRRKELKSQQYRQPLFAKNHRKMQKREVYRKTSHEDTVIPSGPSIRSVEKQRGHTIGNNMATCYQEIQEDSSMVTGVDAHQIDVTTCYPTQKAHVLPVMSSDYEEPRKPERRRSSRLNHVPCEITEVSHKTSHEDTVVPAGPSILSVHKQHGQTIGNDMRKSLQNERSAIVHEVLMSSEEEEIEVNDESQKEANLKETHEACSRVIGDDAHQIDVTACNTTQSHSSAPFMEIIEPSKPPVATGIRRKSRVKDSVTLNSVSSEDTNLDVLHEDFVAPLASSNLNASVEQKKAQKQNDSCSSTKYTEGRRSLRRAAEKVISYKEIPLNVKMRRP